MKERNFTTRIIIGGIITGRLRQLFRLLNGVYPSNTVSAGGGHAERRNKNNHKYQQYFFCIHKYTLLSVLLN